MKRARFPFVTAMILVPALCGAGRALAQCPALDFENLATNTAVTTQYDGVTFSVQAMPASCGASYGRIEQPDEGTSTPTKAVCVDGGTTPSADCEFHPQWLRLVFDQIVHDVRFSVGPGNTEDFQDYTVRVYSTTSGSSGLITTQTITDAGDGVFRVVDISSASNIRRVEIEGRNGLFSMGIECIDDLQFELDTTPPTAEIDAPAYEACGCGFVQVRGVACDDDGTYASDRLEYRPVDAPADSPWVFIDDATAPLCTSGTLYNWDTTALTNGLYFVRLTVANDCGLESSDVTVVYADRLFDWLEMREPDAGDIVGGKACVDGTAWDFRCFEQYSVDYRPAAGGVWQPAGATGVTSTVINDTLATWDTISMGVADGSYLLRLSGIDTCDNTWVVTHPVVVDNSSPTAQITSLAECPALEGLVDIRGTASDANLLNWNLAYMGGGTQTWHTIETGTSAVVNGSLGEWDVSALDPCTYVLRLRVTDLAVVSCDDPHVTDYYAAVNVGLCGDFDVDDDGDVDLVDYSAFLNDFTGPLP